MPSENKPGGFLAGMLPGLVSAGAQMVTSQIGLRRQYKYNLKMAQEQNRMNRENAEWILAQNKALQAEQLAYDSPAAQMARYKEAGLNPHLIYGQGSPGNAGSPVSMSPLPGANVGSVDASMPDLVGSFLSAQQVSAQIANLNQRTSTEAVRTQLTAIQADIAKTNPMLNPQVANVVSEAMMYAAEVKRQQGVILSTRFGDDNTAGERKVMADVEAMEQRLKLNQLDIGIRNKIYESKEFENTIKEIQSKWLKDADITPEHIRQGLMLILSGMVGKL